MSWNDGFERRKFKEIIKKQTEYFRSLGMSEGQISAINEFDREDLSLLDNSITEKEDDLRCKESRARFRAELEGGTVDEDKLFGMITEIAQERYEQLDIMRSKRKEDMDCFFRYGRRKFDPGSAG